MSDKSSNETVRILTASDKWTMAESLILKAAAGATPSICLDEIRNVLNIKMAINSKSADATKRRIFFIKRDTDILSVTEVRNTLFTN